MKRTLSTTLLLGLLTACAQAALEPAPRQSTPVFINELHYDNDGDDTGEAVEIAGPAGTDLGGWRLSLYNGSSAQRNVYDTVDLKGTIPDQTGGFGTLVFSSMGIQNGAPDGIALVDGCGGVVQFLSYGGSFTALDGPAAGLTSTDIGVAEDAGTAADASLQLVGSGATYDDFGWAPVQTNTFGSVNTDQNFVGDPAPLEPCDDGDDGGGADTVTLIHDLQGAGETSPLEGRTVTVEGVVVGDFQDDDGDPFGSDLGGFYVQEEDADADADPETSEGVFVYAPGAADVAAGDLVSLTGVVTEFKGLTEVTDLTRLSVLGTQPLPTPTEITLPLASADGMERFEGMVVVFPQPLVISEYFNFDRYGEIVLSWPVPADQSRPYQPTSYLDPDTQMTAVDAAEETIELSRITLDDGRNTQNPDPARHPNGQVFDLDNRFRGGDTVQGVTGVLTYSFGKYRVQPTAGADYARTNPRPAAPEDVGGTLKVASFNVLNYFNGDGAGGGFPTSRGADDLAEFMRQEAKIVSAIVGTGADIVGLVEIENDPEGETSALDDLTEALNKVAGTGAYAYVETGADGSDEIKVAFVYKPDVVVAIGAAAVLEDDSFTNPRNLDTPKNRPALAQTFAEKATGGVLTVVVNHFKSKGSGCGAGDDSPEQGSCNLTRTLAAGRLADWLAGDPTGSGDPDLLVIGDLNAYDQEDPVQALETAGFTDLILAFQGEFAYSHVFDGQFGYLDYALVNTALLPQVTGATEWHINADEPDLLDYDTTFKKEAQDALFAADPYRSSDHDPVVVGHALNADPQVLVDALTKEVAILRAAGTLNGDQTLAFLKTLEQVSEALAKDKPKTALDQLGTFENQLQEVPAEHLLSLAQALRSALE